MIVGMAEKLFVAVVPDEASLGSDAIAADPNKFDADEEPVLFDYRIIANFYLFDIRWVTFPKKYRL